MVAYCNTNVMSISKIYVLVTWRHVTESETLKHSGTTTSAGLEGTGTCRVAPPVVEGLKLGSLIPHGYKIMDISEICSLEDENLT